MCGCNLAYTPLSRVVGENWREDTMNSKQEVPAEDQLEGVSLSALDLFKGMPPACLQALERGSEVRDVRVGHVFL